MPDFRALARTTLLMGLSGLLAAGCSSPSRQYQRALELEKHNSAERAIPIYEALLARRPAGSPAQRSQLYFRLGECQWRVQRTNDAFASFQQAVEADAENLPAQLRLGELYLAAGVPDRALWHARAVLRRQPQDVQALWIAGSAYAALGLLQQSRDSLARALAADPARVEVAIALADLLNLDNRIAEARSVLRAAVNAQPAAAQPLLALGRLEEQQGNREAAERAYRSAISRQDTAETNHRLAQFLQRGARVSEAENMLRRADYLEPQAPVALADFELLSGRPFAAVRRYEDLLRDQPHPVSLNRAAVAARLIEADLESPHGTGTEPLAQGSSPAARARDHLRQFRHLLDAVTIRILETQIALADGDAKAAGEHAAAAVALAPESAAAHYVFGLVHYRSGDRARARVAWLTASEKDSNFFPARLALAQHALESGDAAAAEEQALPVVREEPGNLRALLLYARALAARRRYPAANMIAKRALAITLVNPEPHILLGDLALSEGRPRDALAHFEQAVVLAPQSQPAIEGLARTYRHGVVSREMLLRMEKIGASAPPSPTILELVGRIYADRGWHADATRALRAALEIDTARASAAAALARLAAQEGKLGAATAAALRTGGDSAALISAVRSQAANHLDAAIRDYELAVRQGDPSGVAANNLAWLYAQRCQNLDRALLLARDARDKAPRNPAFLDTLGVVHLKRREYSEAVSALTQAAEVAALPGAPVSPWVSSQIRSHLEQASRLAGEKRAKLTD